MLTSLPVAIALSALAPEAQAAAPKGAYQIKLDDYSLELRDYNFPSGLRVIFQADHSQPIISITTVIDHGSDADFPNMYGMAHVIEHLAFRAKHGDLPKNMDLIKQLGGNFNASTADDWTNYMTIAPKDALIPLLELEAQRLTNGVNNVTQGDLDLERDICRNELRMRYEGVNNAFGEALAPMAAMLFPEGHPYRNLGIGTHESLDNITLQAVNDFVKKYYRPEYSTIVVVGDFDINKTGEIIEKVFGDQPELLRDAKNPSAPISLAEPKVRLAKERAVPPPPVDRKTKYIEGVVDRTTVVLGWTLPGGYRDDLLSMQIGMNLVGNSIAQVIFEDYDPNNVEEEVGAGCFLWDSELISRGMCFIEPPSGMTPETAIRKASGALFNVWDPEVNKNEIYRQFMTQGFGNAKAGAMAETLLAVDEVATVGGGRATELAHWVHYTGTPTYFSDRFRQINAASMAEAQATVKKYVTEDRMVALVIKPMSEEEKARRTGGAKTGEGNTAYHGTQAEDVFEFAFDVNTITPETIARVTVVPDLSKSKRFQLDNGMKVLLLPYGEAPVVRAGLYLNGNSNTSDAPGLDKFAEALSDPWAEMTASQNLGQVAGDLGLRSMANGLAYVGEAASGNLPAVLDNLNVAVRNFDLSIADKRQQLKNWVGTAKRDGKQPDVWADRMAYATAFPGHPWGISADPAYYEKMDAWGAEQIDGWLDRKYQPSNATLVVVGKIKPEEAEQQIRAAFGDWQKDRDAAAPPPAQLPPLGAAPARRIMVFDKVGATQSDLTMVCPVKKLDNAQQVPAFWVAGDVVSENVWRVLREQQALTYGAGAGISWDPGGATRLQANTLIQNSGVGFGVETFLKLVEDASKGKVDPKMLAAAKWGRAREYVLGHQSGSQMLARLMSVEAQGLGTDFFQTMPPALGKVTTDDVRDVVAPCVGHEVITIVGPKEHAIEQLTALKLPFEVVDWEKLYEAQLTPKELKAYQKAKAEKAAKEAKEAAEKKPSVVGAR